MAESTLPDQKKCTRCGGTKPIDRFGLTQPFLLKSGETKRYKAPECLDCKAEYKRLRRVGLRREPKPEKTERKCCTCRVVKQNAEFHQQRYERGIRFKSECKACQKVRQQISHQADREGRNERNREWRKQHKVERLAYDREYREKNRDKWKIYGRRNYAKRKSAGFHQENPDIKEAVAFTLAQYRIGDKYLDVYSGELIEEPTIDHIVPLSKGGTSDADNLCVTSKKNNASKFNDSLLIWLLKRARRSRNSS